MNWEEKFTLAADYLAREISKHLGYEIVPTDLGLVSPKRNVVEIRSIDGIFFKNGRPLETKWDDKSSLPENWSLPPKAEVGEFVGFTVQFTSGFFISSLVP